MSILDRVLRQRRLVALVAVDQLALQTGDSSVKDCVIPNLSGRKQWDYVTCGSGLRHSSNIFGNDPGVSVLGWAFAQEVQVAIGRVE